MLLLDPRAGSIDYLPRLQSLGADVEHVFPDDRGLHGGKRGVVEWGMLAGGREWTPWLSGKDFVHIGGNMDAKMGLGADTIFLHGGHYMNPAQIWLQHNDTIVFAHDEGFEITGDGQEKIEHMRK